MLTCAFATICVSSSSAQSQPPPQSKEPIGLLADSIDYNDKTKVLIAKGNVRVVSSGQILTANNVTFNQATNRLTIPGGFTITNGDGSTLNGTDADISSDLSRAVIRGAHILIEKQFQMAADKIEYKNNRFKVLDRVVASTCYVGNSDKGYCKLKRTPYWQIRSKRVIHDELTKQLYFENARMEVFGVPILYAPYLRLPDPTVDRASGFLIPTFFTSQTLKFGAKIPYFIAIDDHSDATITAFASAVGSLAFQAQYRRKTTNGQYKLKGTLLLIDGVENNPFRSSLKGDGNFNLKNEYRAGIKVNVASDDTFRAQYATTSIVSIDDENDELSRQDRLFNEVYLERNRKNSFLKTSASWSAQVHQTAI